MTSNLLYGSVTLSYVYVLCKRWQQTSVIEPAAEALATVSFASSCPHNKWHKARITVRLPPNGRLYQINQV